MREIQARRRLELNWRDNDISRSTQKADTPSACWVNLDIIYKYYFEWPRFAVVNFTRKFCNLLNHGCAGPFREGSLRVIRSMESFDICEQSTVLSL